MSTSQGATAATESSAVLSSVHVQRTGFRWIVLFVLALTYFLGSADRANIAVALPSIKAEFGLTNAAAGAVASIFLLGVTLMQIPGSLLIEKWKVRPVMSLAILLTSATTLLTGLSGSGIQMLGARMLLGVAEGPLPVGGLTMINRWFPPKERATAVGIYISAFKLAPALVPPLAAIIIAAFGWRTVFYIFATPGLVVAALWWLLSERPGKNRWMNEAEARYIEHDGVTAGANDVVARRSNHRLLDKLLKTRAVVPLQSNREVLKSANMWGCSVAYGFMAGQAYTLLTWLPTYLVAVKGYSHMQMGFTASAPWIGAIIGAITGGLLSDRFFAERRKPVMLITAGASVFTMYALIAAPDNQLALAALLFATGLLLNIGYATFTVYPMGLATKETVPFAVAIVGSVGALGGAVAPALVGYILDQAGWNMAFAFLSACSVAAFMIVLFIIEPRPQGDVAVAGAPSSAH